MGNITSYQALITGGSNKTAPAHEHRSRLMAKMFQMIETKARAADWTLIKHLLSQVHAEISLTRNHEGEQSVAWIEGPVGWRMKEITVGIKLVAPVISPRKINPTVIRTGPMNMNINGMPRKRVQISN